MNQPTLSERLKARRRVLRTEDADWAFQLIPTDLVEDTIRDLDELVAVLADLVDATDAHTSLEDERKRMPDILERARVVLSRVSA